MNEIDWIQKDSRCKSLRAAIYALALENRALEDRIDELEDQMSRLGMEYETQIDKLKKEILKAEGRDQ